MQYVFTPEPLGNYSQWAFYEGVFDADECDLIRSYFVDESVAMIGSGEVDEVRRKTEVAWVPFNESTRWLYEKLHHYIYNCNMSRYSFELHGFHEAFQVGRYSDGGHYEYHQDYCAGSYSRRKLSFSVQLSSPDDYVGGELKFSGYESGEVVKGLGDLIIFPSFNSHCVTPVTSGVRFSLVGWVWGTPFR